VEASRGLGPGSEAQPGQSRHAHAALELREEGRREPEAHQHEHASYVSAACQPLRNPSIHAAFRCDLLPHEQAVEAQFPLGITVIEVVSEAGPGRAGHPRNAGSRAFVVYRGTGVTVMTVTTRRYGTS
jgi:hypothetical protein